MELQELNRPQPLRVGDKVALVAPSGPVSQERLELAAAAVFGMGLVPDFGAHSNKSRGFLAGDDIGRARDLNYAFASEDIAGIFCLRGGYGAARILDLLNYEMIADSPKVFAGYSDITALHIAINQRANLMTFHTPMAASELFALDEFSRQSFSWATFWGGGARELKNPPGYDWKWLTEGEATGILCGGNLSIIAAGIGTPHEIQTDGKILLIEDVGEEPYRIDRLLRQLLYSGKLSACAAIIFATFENCDTPDTPAIPQILDEILADGKIAAPVLYNYRIGHCLPTASLPLGAMAALNSTTNAFSLI